jgi:succinate-semialdehyde dehydrogenase/glutarate-semialdehyde dehydrogenase
MPKTINPATEEIIETYEYISDNELLEKIDIAQKAFKEWKNTPISKRVDLFKNLAKIMLEQQEELAKLNVIEM